MDVECPGCKRRMQVVPANLEDKDQTIYPYPRPPQEGAYYCLRCDLSAYIDISTDGNTYPNNNPT